jgi:hypothetical protein
VGHAMKSVLTLSALLAVLAIGRASSPVGARATALPAGACTPGMLVERTAIARRVYRPGQRVVITVTLRNQTSSECSIVTGSCVPQVLVTGRAGLVVWNRAATQVVCQAGVGRRLGAGAAVSQTISWDGRVCVGRDPRTCSGRLVPPGRYTVHAIWSTQASSARPFLISR